MLAEWELADPELAVSLYQAEDMEAVSEELGAVPTEEYWEVSEELEAVTTEEWLEWE